MDYDKIFEVLAKKYPNISFSNSGGFGSVPVQAFGKIDDDYFYFRFRFNHATLTVGPYDEKLAELWVQRIREDAEADEARRAGEEKDHWDMFFTAKYRVKMAKHDANPEVNPGYIPILTSRYSSLAGKDPNDGYKGDLDTDEFIEMFSTLVETLKDVPEKEQLREHTRIWLHEGRAAANAYREEEEAASKNNQ